MPTAPAEAKEANPEAKETPTKDKLSQENLEKTVTQPRGAEVELEVDITDDLTISIKGSTETNEKGESTYVGVGQAEEDGKEITVSLGDIIKLFAPDSALPEVLERETISFEYILLTYQSAEKAKWILGVDIDLKALDIANIPLLGTLVEEGLIPLADDLLLLYASETFTKEDVDFINEQIGEDLNQIAVPEKAKDTDVIIKSGINISGKLGYSDDPSLNLSGQDKGDESKSDSDQKDDSDVELKISVWKKVQKKLGPFSLDKIGISFDLAKLTLGFMMDAGLDVDNFSLDVEELSISSTLNKFEPSADFQGIAVTFQQPDLNLAGALVKFHGKDDQGEDYTEYVGELKLDIGDQIRVLAIGAFAEYDHQASFFGYGFIGYPIPIEPPDIVIEGFALGFGFNQGIHAPSVNEVKDFPLVSEVMSMSSSKKGKSESGEGEATTEAKEGESAEGEASTEAKEGESAEGEASTEAKKGEEKKPEDQQDDQQKESASKKLIKEFTSLKKYIFPNINTYFGAVGVKANFVQQVDAFALLMIEGGNRWEFDLFGMAVMDFPPPEVGGGSNIPKLAHIGAALVGNIYLLREVNSLSSFLEALSFC